MSTWPVLVPERAVVVILAGGMGTRMQASLPKQLLSLNGELILGHTLRKFRDPDRFSAVVANVRWYEVIKDIAISNISGPVELVLVEGGTSRNESVWNALEMFHSYDQLRCLVHDGVRPLVTDQLIDSVHDALRTSRAVLPVIDAIDPLVRVVDGCVKRVEARSEVFRGQSPQGFWLQDLKFALDLVGPATMGEYSTLYEVLQSVSPEMRIRSIPGEPNNLKITQSADLLVAEQLHNRGFGDIDRVRASAA